MRTEQRPLQVRFFSVTCLRRSICPTPCPTHRCLLRPAAQVEQRFDPLRGEAFSVSRRLTAAPTCSERQRFRGNPTVDSRGLVKEGEQHQTAAAAPVRAGGGSRSESCLVMVWFRASSCRKCLRSAALLPLLRESQISMGGRRAASLFLYPLRRM